MTAVVCSTGLERRRGTAEQLAESAAACRRMLSGFSSSTRFEYCRDQCVSLMNVIDVMMTIGKRLAGSSAAIRAHSSSPDSRGIWMSEISRSGWLVADPLEGRFAVRRRVDRITFALERDLEHADHVRLVIGN